jgi:hypothetical protein
MYIGGSKTDQTFFFLIISSDKKKMHKNQNSNQQIALVNKTTNSLIPRRFFSIRNTTINKTEN